MPDETQKALVAFIATGDESPTGIKIMVDGWIGEIVASERNLAAALRAAEVEDICFVIDENLRDPISSTWVLLIVGPNENQ